MDGLRTGWQDLQTGGLPSLCHHAVAPCTGGRRLKASAVATLRARDSLLPQENPAEPPQSPWDIVCCPYLVQILLRHLKGVVGTTKWRWQVWGSSLLGVHRDKELLPWKVRMGCAAPPRAASPFHRMLPHSLSSLLLGSLRRHVSFAAYYSLVPPLPFISPAATLCCKGKRPDL